MTRSTEAFDLLYSYPCRILNPPDATLADLGLQHCSLLQRPFSDLPPASNIRSKIDHTTTHTLMTPAAGGAAGGARRSTAQREIVF